MKCKKINVAKPDIELILTWEEAKELKQVTGSMSIRGCEKPQYIFSHKDSAYYKINILNSLYHVLPEELDE